MIINARKRQKMQIENAELARMGAAEVMQQQAQPFVEAMDTQTQEIKQAIEQQPQQLQLQLRQFANQKPQLKAAKT